LINQSVFKRLFRGVGQPLALAKESKKERKKILGQCSGASDEVCVFCFASVLLLEFSARTSSPTNKNH
jgi:hypothetical protein